MIRAADQVLTRPAGTPPQKCPDPYQLEALYRLLAASDVTHAAVLRTDCQRTYRRMAEATGAVIPVPHDDTRLDVSGIQVDGLGPVGDANGRGFVARTSTAATPAGAALGPAHRAPYVHPPEAARRPATDWVPAARVAVLGQWPYGTAERPTRALAGSIPPRIIASCVGVTGTLASVAAGKANVPFSCRRR